VYASTLVRLDYVGDCRDHERWHQLVMARPRSGSVQYTEANCAGADGCRRRIGDSVEQRLFVIEAFTMDDVENIGRRLTASISVGCIQGWAAQ